MATLRKACMRMVFAALNVNIRGDFVLFGSDMSQQRMLKDVR